MFFLSSSPTPLLPDQARSLLPRARRTQRALPTPYHIPYKPNDPLARTYNTVDAPSGIAKSVVRQDREAPVTPRAGRTTRTLRALPRRDARDGTQPAQRRLWQRAVGLSLCASRCLARPFGIIPSQRTTTSACTCLRARERTPAPWLLPTATISGTVMQPPNRIGSLTSRKPRAWRRDGKGSSVLHTRPLFSQTRQYNFYRAARFFRRYRSRHLSNKMAEKRVSRGGPTDICNLNQKHWRPHPCADDINWRTNLVPGDEYVKVKRDYTLV